MAKLFYIDVSALPTYEERYAVLQKFDTEQWDIYEHTEVLDALHRTFSFFEVFWFSNTDPELPSLPSCVKIIEK